MDAQWLIVADEVRAAVQTGRPVVALESTLVAHGLPWPANVETARECEAVIRKAGAVPATIAVLAGRPTVGLTDAQLEGIAKADGVLKAGRRDLAAAVALKRHAATTVSATMALAHAAGVRVFATGGIGGAHRESAFDISADLTELSRTPVLVVCSGAKSILDLPRTLEILETLGVPVLGYRTDQFPTFYTAGAVGSVTRVEAAADAAAAFAAHARMGGGGMVLAHPCPADVAVAADAFNRALTEAELDAAAEGATGPQLTPFLLSRLAELTDGKTLAANRALIVANAKLAADVAAALVT
jgi:pseudouridine-5'-phosphate glycosidase